MKQGADKHRRDVQFSVGDWVYVKLRPHCQQSGVKRINPKLIVKFYEPFQIEAIVGAIAYRLHLPPIARIHLMFHVSQLRKAAGEHSVESVLPPKLAQDQPASFEPIAILTSHECNINGESITEWLIQWKNKLVEEATWEATTNI